MTRKFLRQRPCPIKIYLTATEKAQLLAMAEARDCAPSELVREMIRHGQAPSDPTTPAQPEPQISVRATVNANPYADTDEWLAARRLRRRR